MPVRFLAAALIWAASAFGTLAQELPSETYTEFQQLVGRVDRVLDADRATDEVLSRLRDEVDSFRTQFLEAQDTNAAQIERVQRQLDTLGPPPAEGESEPSDISSRREALQSELATLRMAPRRAAEAFAEADAVIRQIDTAIRERQAEQALRRYPEPVNPLNWERPLREINGAILAVPEEIIRNLDSAGERGQILRNLPQAALSLIFGAILVFRTRAWSDRLTREIDGVQRRILRRLLRLVTVLAELALPLGGLFLLLAALPLTGIFGPIGREFLLATYAFGAVGIVNTWLVRQLYPKRLPETSPMRISPSLVGKARRAAILLALTTAFYRGLQVLGERLDFEAITTAYAGYVLSVLTAVGVYRTAQLFRRSVRDSRADATGEEDEADFSGGVIRVLATLAMVLCVVSIIVGLAGYVVLAKQIVYPMAGTYLLFGLLIIVQRAVRDFYLLLVGRDGGKEDEEGLVPTLIGAMLLLASIPGLALIWGARPTDLLEVWVQIREGFAIGDVNVSPSELLTFLIVFLIGFTITRLLQGGLKNSILPKTKLDTGARNALISGLGYIGLFLAAIAAITAAGINLSSLAIFASALAVGVGFGLQTIVSNFVSGIILLIERPVAEGDWIDVNGNMGIVRRISVRSTRIETFDRTDVIVPNADLVSGVVTNWTRGSLQGRVILAVGVAYGTDTRKVERILTDIAMAHPLVVISPPPLILFMGFGADALDFEMRVILRDVNYSLTVRSELNHEIARRFAEEGVEIPFAQRDLWIRNPEALRPPAARGHSEDFAAAPPRRDDLAMPESADFAGADGDGAR